MAFATRRAAQPGRESRSAGQVDRAKRVPIIDLGGPTLPFDLDALLGQVCRKVGAIVQRGDITIGEAQLETAAVLSVEITALRRGRDNG